MEICSLDPLKLHVPSVLDIRHSALIEKAFLQLSSDTPTVQ